MKKRNMQALAAGGGRDGNGKRRGPALRLGLLFLLMLVLGSCSAEDGRQEDASLPADEELAVHFLDVGQADATLLISRGEAMLIDAGNRDDADFLVEYLRELGIESLRYIVFTHPHEDHIGSGEAVIEHFDVDQIYRMDEYEEGIEGDLQQAIAEKGIATDAPVPGEQIQFGECEILFLGPMQDYQDTNDDSICLKVSHGESSFLFTGDAGSAPERQMIEAGFDLEADVLQAGHHGSSTSSSYYFLRQVNPAYVVISCGKDNMYGHPHQEALSRFRDLGAELFRTDGQGTVIATDDGTHITFHCEGEKSDRPYTADPEEANYIGNINSRKYHAPDCSSLPEEKNRVYFMSIEAAEKAGYSPCGRCNP